MTKRRTYALLIYDASGGEGLGDAEERRVLRGHRSVQTATSEVGTLHAVARLDPPDARTRTVRVKDGEHLVTDGPFIETKEWLVGFYLVDCASETEAIAHAKAICPTGAHAIEIRLVPWRRGPGATR